VRALFDELADTLRRGHPIPFELAVFASGPALGAAWKCATSPVDMLTICLAAHGPRVTMRAALACLQLVTPELTPAQRDALDAAARWSVGRADFHEAVAYMEVALAPGIVRRTVIEENADSAVGFALSLLGDHPEHVPYLTDHVVALLHARARRGRARLRARLATAIRRAVPCPRLAPAALTPP